MDMKQFKDPIYGYINVPKTIVKDIILRLLIGLRITVLMQSLYSVESIFDGDGTSFEKLM